MSFGCQRTKRSTLAASLSPRESHRGAKTMVRPMEIEHLICAELYTQLPGGNPSWHSLRPSSRILKGITTQVSSRVTTQLITGARGSKLPLALSTQGAVNYVMSFTPRILLRGYRPKFSKSYRGTDDHKVGCGTEELIYSFCTRYRCHSVQIGVIIRSIECAPSETLNCRRFLNSARGVFI